MLSFWLLGACLSNEAVLSTHADPPQDSVAWNDSPADTQEAEGEEEETPEDTGEKKETEPDPELDFSDWSAVVTFQGSGCTETVSETGALLDPGSASALYAACADCDLIYEINASRSSACNVAIPRPLHRGLRLGDGWALVYGFDEGTPILHDSGGTFSDPVLRFDYTESINGGRVEVSVVATFSWIE